MVNISKIGNSIIFETNDKSIVIPNGNFTVITNDESDIVNVRIKASRQNIIQFYYNDTNLDANSKDDLIEKISNL